MTAGRPNHSSEATRSRAELPLKRGAILNPLIRRACVMAVGTAYAYFWLRRGQRSTTRAIESPQSATRRPTRRKVGGPRLIAIVLTAGFVTALWFLWQEFETQTPTGPAALPDGQIHLYLSNPNFRGTLEVDARRVERGARQIF